MKAQPSRIFKSPGGCPVFARLILSKYPPQVVRKVTFLNSRKMVVIAMEA